MILLLDVLTGIQAGSEILSNAKLAVLYSNRSAAYVGQGQLDLACHDADTAVRAAAG